MIEGNFRFIRWPLYQDAKRFSVLCHRIVEKLPKEYRFEIGSQVMRSSVSVALNIAEGSGKPSDRDFNRYLSISQGSLFETTASIDLLNGLGLLDKQDFKEILALGTKISNQLSGLKKALYY